MVRAGFVLAVMLCFGADVRADVKLEAVDYRHGEVQLQGFVAYDDGFQGPRPGILVVHEWMGLGEYAKQRATQLAQLGFVAFAADMYGKGVYAKDHQEAGQLAGTIRNDRTLMRGRIQAALEVLKNNPRVDIQKLGAIGYCFGGTSVLELARSGAEVDGVVSFNGALGTPMPAKPGAVKAKVLVCHGAADTFVSQEEVAGFEQEMREAGVEYRLVQYPGAVHSFTVKEAGRDPSKGMAYNDEADRQSWNEMLHFFQALWGTPMIPVAGQSGGEAGRR